MKPSNAKTQKSAVSASSPSVILMVVLSFIWMLAVVKVFLLEGHHTISHESGQIAPTLIDFSQGATLKKASDLAWPPVQQDGTISVSDGVEIMPVIGLKVPRFFMPPPEVDINKVGSKVNGQETIFLMIASYRDPQCRETITTAYNRADYPERLFIGAVDQLVDGDIGCVDLDISCIDDPTQMICKYRDQISVYKMDATYSTGPVTGESASAW